MTDEQALIEGLKALAQIGISAVFIWAWFQERKINVDVVNTYMKLREKALELETEKVRLEYAQYVRGETRTHLLKTEVPESK